MKTVSDFMKAMGLTCYTCKRSYDKAVSLLETGMLQKSDIISMRPPFAVGKRKKYYPVEITDEAYERLLTVNDTNALIKSEAGVLPPNPTFEECVEDSRKAIAPTITPDNAKLIAFAKCIRACEGSINVGMMAKILTKNGVHMTEHKLFDYFRQNGFLEEVGNIRNVPTDTALLSGYFDFTEVLIEVNGKHPIISFTPKITGLGQLFILDKFGCTTDDWLPY